MQRCPNYSLKCLHSHADRHRKDMCQDLHTAHYAQGVSGTLPFTFFNFKLFCLLLYVRELYV